MVGKGFVQVRGLNGERHRRSLTDFVRTRGLEVLAPSGHGSSICPDRLARNSGGRRHIRLVLAFDLATQKGLIRLRGQFRQ